MSSQQATSRHDITQTLCCDGGGIAAFNRRLCYTISSKRAVLAEPHLPADDCGAGALGGATLLRSFQLLLQVLLLVLQLLNLRASQARNNISTKVPLIEAPSDPSPKIAIHVSGPSPVKPEGRQGNISGESSDAYSE